MVGDAPCGGCVIVTRSTCLQLAGVALSYLLTDRLLGLVAERFGLSAGLVRLLFVVSIVLPGPQFLVYLALWIVIPRD